MTKTWFAALTALTIAASPALANSEQPHDGRITPTYSGGYVGSQSNEAAGGFDLSRATPLLGGGHIPGQHSAEASGGFLRQHAIWIGRASDGSRVTALSGGFSAGG
jgi:hypothetical protein